jgi:hypothetical protein
MRSADNLAHLIDGVAGLSIGTRRRGAYRRDELRSGATETFGGGRCGSDPRTGLGDIASPRGTLLRSRVPQEQFLT